MSRTTDWVIDLQERGLLDYDPVNGHYYPTFPVYRSKAEQELEWLERESEFYATHELDRTGL